ncbi:MAG: ribosomal L7Ae/L30e/S12e/Gadd45 family protein [bacterium]|nr:ribosomal L7Ae/L30e/S12e/Gadd45 family protein [bacterium]
MKRAQRRTVGAKQTLKAVDRGIATLVVVARDADERVLRDLLRCCEERGVTVLYAESMEGLGRACGIQVGAAAAAVIEE